MLVPRAVNTEIPQTGHYGNEWGNTEEQKNHQVRLKQKYLTKQDENYILKKVLRFLLEDEDLWEKKNITVVPIFKSIKDLNAFLTQIEFTICSEQEEYLGQGYLMANAITQYHEIASTEYEKNLGTFSISLRPHYQDIMSLSQLYEILIRRQDQESRRASILIQQLQAICEHRDSAFDARIQLPQFIRDFIQEDIELPYQIMFYRIEKSGSQLLKLLYNTKMINLLGISVSAFQDIVNFQKSIPNIFLSKPFDRTWNDLAEAAINGNSESNIKAWIQNYNDERILCELQVKQLIYSSNEETQELFFLEKWTVRNYIKIDDQRVNLNSAMVIDQLKEKPQADKGRQPQQQQQILSRQTSPCGYRLK